VLVARCAETCIFNGNYGGAVDRESDDAAACHLLEFVNTEDHSALLAAARTTATLDDQWALHPQLTLVAGVATTQVLRDGLD
jgi:hypothetical protein